MFKCLINYNFTPDKSWIGDNYLIYDRSDDGIDHLADFDKSKVIKKPNIGNVDYDKLNYLIDNYYNLPDVFFWGKTNLFKYITPEEWEKVKDNQTFTPILTQTHRTYSDNLGVVSYYEGGMFYERNDSWYIAEHGTKYFNSYASFAHFFQLPNPFNIPFAPGGNYILTRERVHRYSVDYYKQMASILPYSQLPGEAQMLERSYYTIWR